MTNYEINIEILKLMGYKVDHLHFVKITDFGKYSTSTVKYNASWDWLMTVVEKIESLGYTVSIELNTCEIAGEDYDTLIDYDSNKLITTFGAVGNFAKWYNK